MGAQRQKYTALLQALLEKPFMDDALFLNNVIQNVLIELPNLAVNATEKPESSQPFKSPFKSFSGFVKKFWMSPSEWEYFSQEAKRANAFALEHWDELSEDHKVKLIKLCESGFTASSGLKTATVLKGKRSLLRSIRSSSLIASSNWASLVLKRDVIDEIFVEVEGFMLSILTKAQSARILNSEYYPSSVLVLSDADSQLFLESLDNPSKPSKELVSLFSE